MGFSTTVVQKAKGKNMCCSFVCLTSWGAGKIVIKIFQLKDNNKKRYTKSLY